MDAERVRRAPVVPGSVVAVTAAADQTVSPPATSLNAGEREGAGL